MEHKIQYTSRNERLQIVKRKIVPYGKTTIINSPYDVNKHVPYGVTKTIYRLLCIYEQNHTLLN